MRRAETHPGAQIARGANSTPAGFTLIELMVVVGIMGLILAAGIPSLYKLMQREGMRKVTFELSELCKNARGQAILRGAPVDLVFRPLDHTVAIGGGAPARESAGTESGAPLPEKPTVFKEGQSLKIPDDYVIEMLDVNLWEYNESEQVRVRFYPNGTCDEMTLVLRSPKNEWKKISLEVTTGLASVDEVQR